MSGMDDAPFLDRWARRKTDRRRDDDGRHRRTRAGKSIIRPGQRSCFMREGVPEAPGAPTIKDRRAISTANDYDDAACSTRRDGTPRPQVPLALHRTETEGYKVVGP